MYNFRLKEQSKKNNLYLKVTYMGGDADTYHPTYYLFPFGYDNWEANQEEIENKVNIFKELKDILESDVNYDLTYEEVEKEYGKEMARSWEDVPNDPQSDYQFKCSLDSIELIGYDNDCNMYQSWI